MQSRGRPSSFSPLDIPELKVERGRGAKELFKEWWKKGMNTFSLEGMKWKSV